MSKLLVDEISDADNTGPVTVTDGLTVQGAFTSLGIDDNATSTAMTIDSSGNVLVGKTSAGAASVGFEARANGFNAFTRDGGQPLEVRRLTSDGVLIDLRKDGTTVGSIGYIASGLYIDGEGGHAGLRFGGADITPRDGGADADAAIQLGQSGARFTDLYLSGGVYLGGTGAANYLDDYEEGTWTPTVQGATGGGTYTLSGTTAKYTKVGNQVTVWGQFGFSAASGGTSYAVIGSLPFTYASGAGVYGVVRADSFNFTTANPASLVVGATTGASGTTLNILELRDNAGPVDAPISGVSTSTFIGFTVTYYV
jgi:hypothetical protein